MAILLHICYSRFGRNDLIKKPVKTPLLPEGRVIEILSGDCELFNNWVEQSNIIVHRLPPDARLPLPVRGHADLQCCSLKCGQLITSADIEITGYETIKISEALSDEYPHDCQVNVFRLGNSIIAGRHASNSVFSFAERAGLEILITNQGYAKCSCAIVSDDAVITADRAIASALSSTVDVLLIKPGGIELPGYDYGFIGGCCGKLNKDVLCFLGDPLTHPDGKSIVSFCEKHGCGVFSLSNGILYDFGGFIPLFEEE